MSWQALADGIARRTDAGRAVEFWWRDDDAAAPSEALARLLALQAESGVPLALAVIPLRAGRPLFASLQEDVCVLQHGTDHVNRAAQGEKKTEFSDAEPAQAALARLALGRERLEQIAGKHFLPVLAPPWNRLARGLVPRLHEAGFIGLSRYGARRATESATGLVEVNAHVDIIDWRGTRGFVGEEVALAAALTHLEHGEPLGWLTHHAVHEAAAWDFLARLFEFTSAMPALTWRGAREIFHKN